MFTYCFHFDLVYKVHDIIKNGSNLGTTNIICYVSTISCTYLLQNE